MNNAPSPQMGERGHVRVPRASMQFVDAQKQKGPINVPPVHLPIQQQPTSPRTQQQQQQQQQQQPALYRSLSVSPTQQAGLQRSMSVSPIPHAGQFEGPQQPARRMSSPQQAYITPMSQDGGLTSPLRRMPTLQEGRRPSPTKRASFDSQLERVAPPFLQEKQEYMAPRYASPTKRKTVVTNLTSFDVPARPQMGTPARQDVASPRKSTIQQGQALSPRKSTMMMPQMQLASPRKSMMQQQDQAFSPRKSMLLQQGNVNSSLSAYPENSIPLLEQENIPAATSYINRRSMSVSPAVHEARFDEEDDDAYNDNIAHPRPINRATSMSPAAPSVRFQENEAMTLPPTSFKRSMSFSPVAQSMIKQQQVSLPAKMQPNLNAHVGVSPRQIQIQPQAQHPASPARLQSSINRSMSISPTQMNVEQQSQPRLSSGHLAEAQLGAQ